MPCTLEWVPVCTQKTCNLSELKTASAVAYRASRPADVVFLSVLPLSDATVQNMYLPVDDYPDGGGGLLFAAGLGRPSL
jgi:hypothetical protein